MIKLLWRFGLLIIAALFFTWLADRPGTVTIQWMGREIQMAFVIAVALAFLTLALLWFVWGFFRRIWRSPTAARDYWRFRKNRKAYESLSRGIIAAGAGDSIAASKHAAIAGNALADEPLVNVLAAQAAQLKGDRASVKRIFEAMTKSSETEALGLRGLFAEARQNGDVTSAMVHAERALKLNPRLAWASSAVLQLQSLRKDWSGAAATLQQQAKSGLMPNDESNQKQAIMLAAQALAIEDTNSAEALALALKAHKLDAGLVPAALVAARIYASQNSPRKVVKIIRETWGRSPHPDLAQVLAHAKPGDGPEPRFERVRDLVSGSPDSLEGAYALARAAVAAQRWDAARKTLEPFLADQPQASGFAPSWQISKRRAATRAGPANGSPAPSARPAIPCGCPMAWPPRAGCQSRPFPVKSSPASGKRLLKCWPSRSRKQSPRPRRRPWLNPRRSRLPSPPWPNCPGRPTIRALTMT